MSFFLKRTFLAAITRSTTSPDSWFHEAMRGQAKVTLSPAACCPCDGAPPSLTPLPPQPPPLHHGNSPGLCRCLQPAPLLHPHVRHCFASQRVRSYDAFQARISPRSCHSSQPTRQTGDPHMAPGPSSPPELQSQHINHINFLTIPQGSIFRTC